MKIGNTRSHVNTNKVTRFEIIDHRPCEECEGTGQVSVPSKKEKNATKQQCLGCGGTGVPGRTVVVHNKGVQCDIEFQDDDRTLKVFMHPRYEEVG